MNDNFYTFDVSTVVSNTCTVKATNKEEALKKIKEYLKSNFEEMLEQATFEDTIEGPFDPSEEAVESLKEYPMCDITWRG